MRPWGASVVAAVLAVAVALLGGSARFDAGQNAILQPIAVLAIGFSLMKLRRADIAGFRLPLVLLGLLALLMAIQLIPLPQDLWAQLPGRGAIGQLQVALGFDMARPLSLVPSRTLYAFFALAIPASALFVYLTLDRGTRLGQALGTVVAMGVVSAVLAALQLLGPPDSVVYFYRVSNFGEAVGLFANSNHAAVFGSLALVVTGCCIAGTAGPGAPTLRLLPLVGAFGLILLVVLIGGSRLGLVTGALALTATGAMYIAGGATHPVLRRKGVRLALGGGLVLVLLAIGLMLFAANRIPALDEMMTASPMEDMRVRIAGTLVRMAGEYFPAGAGFGSFEDVYYIAEPDSELRPEYLNMAHNDWLQFTIEAGLPGIVLLLGAIWLFVRIAIALGAERARRPAVIAFVAGVAIVAVASLFDYPLRAPLFQFACVLLLACACDYGFHRGRTSGGE